MELAGEMQLNEGCERRGIELAMAIISAATYGKMNVRSSKPPQLRYRRFPCGDVECHKHRIEKTARANSGDTVIGEDRRRQEEEEEGEKDDKL